MKAGDERLEADKDDLFVVLEMLRRKPALYLGQASISRMEGFLSGYSVGLERFHVQMKSGEDFHAFQTWLAKRLGFDKSTKGWCTILLETSASDADAFRRFFELLDEFRSAETAP